MQVNLGKYNDLGIDEDKIRMLNLLGIEPLTEDKRKEIVESNLVYFKVITEADYYKKCKKGYLLFTKEALIRDSVEELYDFMMDRSQRLMDIRLTLMY
ncbi:hypothetical protein SRCM101294_00106 [Bacillus amyloliquefaciens]|uniref:hypothetical protein n=1 Tax=Bacillus amyloliquefaciens TaxID=1390 RepID=UPI00080C4A32|nr:hypothetical protein [Bacillus amyloliquefaciens]OCB99017.1 hypothetical protein SRCM101294_00106 [Bacillus amyloliquefaciens]